MAREIIFPEQNLPGGDFKIKFEIDNAETPELIVNESDYYLSGASNWLAYSPGATVTYEVLWGMKVHIDAVLNGANLLSPTAGKRYKLYGYFPNPGGSTQPVSVYIGGIYVGQITSRVTGELVEFYFTAKNNSNILYLKCNDDFYVKEINIEEVDYAYNVKLGDVSIGNDNDVDWIMYPGNFDLHFKVQPDVTSGFLRDFYKWLEVNNALTKYDVLITIYKYKDNEWKEWLITSIDKEDIDSESKSKVFKVKCLDALSVIKNERQSYIATYLEYYDNHRTTIEGLIHNTLGLAANIGNFIFRSAWKVKEKNTTNEFPISDCYIAEIGLRFPSDLNGETFSNQPFSTRGDQVKALMNNLASYFILAPFYQKIVMPLEYNGDEVYTLYANEMPPLETFPIKKYSGVNSYIHNGIVDYAVGRDYVLRNEDRYMESGNLWEGYDGGTVEQQSGFISVQDSCRLYGDTKVAPMTAGRTYTIGFKCKIITATSVQVGVNGSAQLISVTDDGTYTVTFVAGSDGNEIIFWADGTFTLWFCSIDDGTQTGRVPTKSISDYLNIYFPFPLDGATAEYSGYSSITIDEAGTREAEIWSAKYKKRDGTFSEADSFVNHCNAIIVGQLDSDRYGLIAKPKGTEIPLDKFFEIRQSRNNTTKIIDAVFRAKKAVVSPTNNRTELYLVKC